MTTRRVLLVAFMILCAAFMACRKSTPLFNAQPIDIPQTSAGKLTLDEIRETIIKAASRQGWTIVSQSPGVVTARLVARHDYSVTVDIRYTETAYTITYNDSAKLNYNPKSQSIHPAYGRWIAYLTRSINVELHNAPLLLHAQ